MSVSVSNATYQWVKDGLPLIEGVDFTGCNRPILLLNNSWITDGAYVCNTRGQQYASY